DVCVRRLRSMILPCSYTLSSIFFHLTHLNFFFLTLRPPPRSTLFPYTTLFRSHNFLYRQSQPLYLLHACHCYIYLHPSHSQQRRSEEHTSELQSRFDLVCRLLLEKKKKYKSLRNNSSNNSRHITHNPTHTSTQC